MSSCLSVEERGLMMLCDMAKKSNCFCIQRSML